MIFYSPFWCRVSLSDWLKKIDFCRLAPILIERFLILQNTFEKGLPQKTLAMSLTGKWNFEIVLVG